VKSKTKFSRSVLSRSIASAFGMSAALTGAASAADTADNSALPEVTVTAQHRSESIQDVPITIQAITFDELSKLSITSIDEAVKFLPNITLGANGPGQGNIFMRGLSAGMEGNQSSATIAPFPNVALYLDDQSMQFPSRNLDVYLVDMERIEVLEGPQGTLFGGGAQAGAVRYITNKPKLNKDSGSAEASYGVTSHGDPNSKLDLVLNIALDPGKFAIRGVIYNDHRGGYINNVPSHFTRNNNDPGTAVYSNITPGSNGLCPNGLPTTTGVCPPVGAHEDIGNNQNVTGYAQNPVTTHGMRLSGLYEINDNWELLISQSFQSMDARGSSSQMPIGSDGQNLGPLETTVFSPMWDKDNFESTSWTLNGQIGDFKTVYTGSYLTRNIDQQSDYSNYSRSAGGAYYLCAGPNGSVVASSTYQCYSPVSSWRDMVKNKHQSHELRVSTPDNWRVRGIGGVFYEDYKILDVMNFDYKTVPSCSPLNLQLGIPCVANVQTAPGSTATNPGTRGDSTAFGEDAQRGYKQTAVFGSVDYDLIPKTLTVTAGTRWYRYSEFETGSQYATVAGCDNIADGNCTSGLVNIDAEGLRTTYTGTRSRASISWHIDQDMMAYATFSQGYRPGAFNRSTGNILKLDGVPQYRKPISYGPDQLNNFEAGFKGEFLNRRLVVDATAYHMVWKNVQLLFFNPGAGFGHTTFGVNGPDYKVDGGEIQATGKLGAGFTLMASGSFNHAKQANSPCMIGNLPASPTFGQCVTISGSSANPTHLSNPYGEAGTPPAYSPTVQWNLRGRYDWSDGNQKWYAMLGANHTSHSYNEPATYPSGENVAVPGTTHLRYDMSGYTIYDASVGVTKDAWHLQLNGANLANNHASTLSSSAQFVRSDVPLRPRVLTLTMGYSF
jgi:outer membrane receptor protein involved in Fe transport